MRGNKLQSIRPKSSLQRNSSKRPLVVLLHQWSALTRCHSLLLKLKLKSLLHIPSTESHPRSRSKGSTMLFSQLHLTPSQTPLRGVLHPLERDTTYPFQRVWESHIHHRQSRTTFQRKWITRSTETREAATTASSVSSVSPVRISSLIVRRTAPAWRKSSVKETLKCRMSLMICLPFPQPILRQVLKRSKNAHKVKRS